MRPKAEVSEVICPESNGSVEQRGGPSPVFKVFWEVERVDIDLLGSFLHSAFPGTEVLNILGWLASGG